MIFFSSFRKWKDALREAEVPFQEKFLPYAMSPYLRSQVSISEAKMTTQNLSILSALDDPILIIDPYQISLEYLELLHVDDKITMLHIGGDFLLNNLKTLEMTCSIAFFSYFDPYCFCFRSNISNTIFGGSQRFQCYYYFSLHT